MDLLVAFVCIVLDVVLMSIMVLKAKDRVVLLLGSGIVAFGVVAAAKPIAANLGFMAFYTDDLWLTLPCVLLSFGLIFAYLVNGWAYKLGTVPGSTVSPVLINNRREAATSRKTVSNITPKKQVVLDVEGASTVWEM